jgi:Xaa-Pro aminopeptidase
LFAFRRRREVNPASLGLVFDYVARRARFDEQMSAAGVDAAFLPISSDLEYLTGLRRGIPNFGNVSQAHDWVTGCFLRPGRAPVFLVSRMHAEFDMGEDAPGELVVVRETDDGREVFDRVASGVGPVRTLAVGARLWAETTMQLLRTFDAPALVSAEPLVNRLRRIKSPDELEVMGRAAAIADGTMAAVQERVRPGVTMDELVEEVEHQMRVRGSRAPSFTTHVFTGGERDGLDSRSPTGDAALPPGDSVLFDFGAVLEGYCSDFGRTVFCGEPPAEYRRAYQVMLDAQEAGRQAARPGVPCAEVNRACRAPIEEAGYGPYFRHRMGHGIGLDVHERPFISVEDQTPLEVGMTFTDEPSIVAPGRVGVRIEDVVVCEAGGGRKLNAYPPDLVATG